MIAAVNVFLAYVVFKLTRKDVNLKVYVISKIDDSKDDDFHLNVTLHPTNECDFNQNGFPEIRNDEKLWKMELHNNGDLPATNIVLEYILTIKKADFDFGIDEADIINQKFVEYKTYNQKVEVDYLAPNSFKEIDIMYLYGGFLQADLKFYKLTSKEESFIQKLLLIDSYEHLEFKVLQDSHHSRQMLGAYK